MPPIRLVSRTQRLRPFAHATLHCNYKSGLIIYLTFGRRCHPNLIWRISPFFISFASHFHVIWTKCKKLSGQQRELNPCLRKDWCLGPSALDHLPMQPCTANWNLDSSFWPPTFYAKLPTSCPNFHARLLTACPIFHAWCWLPCNIWQVPLVVLLVKVQNSFVALREKLESSQVGWPSGLKRLFKAQINYEVWVQKPPKSGNCFALWFKGPHRKKRKSR